MTEYRVDDLAREAGTTVRNVRAYQDRGLIPPPRREGRVGWYSDHHLARLRAIAALLARGYTLGNIGELLDAVQSGDDVAGVIDMPLSANPFSDEIPERTTIAELAGRVGPITPDVVRSALELGFVSLDGDEVVVHSPRLLRAGERLAALGVPVEDLLHQLRSFRADVEHIAEGIVDMVFTHVLARFGDELPDPSSSPELVDVLTQMRPLAESVVDVELTRAVELHVRRRLGAEIGASIDAVVRADAGRGAWGRPEVDAVIEEDGATRAG